MSATRSVPENEENDEELRETIENYGSNSQAGSKRKASDGQTNSNPSILDEIVIDCVDGDDDEDEDDDEIDPEVSMKAKKSKHEKVSLESSELYNEELR